jgi:hypothetical protein
MGGALSTYAGSNDIARFASTEGEEPTKYDYIICGGKYNSVLGYGIKLKR